MFFFFKLHAGQLCLAKFLHRITSICKICRWSLSLSKRQPCAFSQKESSMIQSWPARRIQPTGFFSKRQRITTSVSAYAAERVKRWLLPTRAPCGRCRKQHMRQLLLLCENRVRTIGWGGVVPKPRCNLLDCFDWITHCLEAWQQFLTVWGKSSHYWNSSMHSENLLTYAFGKLGEKAMSSYSPVES